MKTKLSLNQFLAQKTPRCRSGHHRPTIRSSTRPRRVSWCELALALVITVGMSLINVPVQARSHDYCNDVEFIFARGSGEELGGPNYTRWQSAITEALGETTLKYNFRDLGSEWMLGYNYPAVAVGNSLLGYAHLVGAFVSSGESYAFGRSVQTGADSLARTINDMAAACPDTRYILGGYSQGAMVVMQSLPKIDDPHKVLYAATFGDPKLFLPEGAPIDLWSPKIPDACRGKNLSTYRAWVPDCWAYEGILGGTNPYEPNHYYGKIGAWCNKKDIMCSSGLNTDDHISYVDDNIYENAAQLIARKVRQRFRQHFPQTVSLPNLHDVLFLFDATGSMQPYIDHYKEEAKRLAQQVIQSGGRISLYSYSDEKQGAHAEEECDFSCKEAEFADKIDSIIPDGGGDSAESALAAIMTGLNGLDWRFGAVKTIVLLTDNIYHDPDFDLAKTTLEDVVRRALEIDPVNVYVLAPPLREEPYRKLTSLTNGKFFNVDDDQQLQLSTDTIYYRPVAQLAFDHYYGSLNDELTFDASTSYGFGDQPLQYDWDLDGNGEFEILNGSAAVSHAYASSFNNFIQVRVHDELGSSTMSAKVEITPSTPTEAPTQILSLSAEKATDSSAKLHFTTDADQVLLSLGDLPMGFIKPTLGDNTLTIGELTDDLAITLTPYSRSEQRGISRSIQLSATSLSPGGNAKPSEGDDNTKPSGDTGNAELSESHGTKPSNNLITVPSTPPRPHATISTPKAPNTGCYDERLLRASR